MTMRTLARMRNGLAWWFELYAWDATFSLGMHFFIGGAFLAVLTWSLMFQVGPTEILSLGHVLGVLFLRMGMVILAFANLVEHFERLRPCLLLFGPRVRLKAYGHYGLTTLLALLWLYSFHIDPFLFWIGFLAVIGAVEIRAETDRELINIADLRPM